MAKNRKKGNEGSAVLTVLLSLLLIVTIALSCMMAYLCTTVVKRNNRPQPGPSQTEIKAPPEETEIPETPARTEPTETTLPPASSLVSSAKVTVTGDLLPHKTVYGSGSLIMKGAQDYDFTPIFKFLKGYTDTADYAVANLETSLFGPQKAYSGNPNFNTPDQLVDGAKNAGFDLLLTANNHCNDTGIEGVLRTVKVVREKGLTALGTNLTEEEDKYHIEEINGIQIGMLCYTYEDSQAPNQVTLNYHPLPSSGKNLVCTFPKFSNAKSRDPFYEQLSAQIGEMKEKGAELIVLFVHWGEEYHLEATEDQKNMAQKFCDLGVDLVIGGHPHVVEPVELFTGTQNPDHKMVCLYSLGNAFSNQRREEMSSQPSGHTEDGMLFSFTAEKYEDGSVYLSQVQVIPTWVNKHRNNEEEKREYNILPLEDSRRQEWQSMYSLPQEDLHYLNESYDRTMAIVGPGLETANTYLVSQLPGASVSAETDADEEDR